MHEIGLYYPYFHVRDDAWLKAAALYLPQVARVRPPGYPVRDSATTAALRDQLDFLRDVDPAPQAALVAQEFHALVEREETALRARYRLPDAPAHVGPEVGNPWFLDASRFAWMHTSQLGATPCDDPEGTGSGPATPGSPLVDRLYDLGLAVGPRFDPITGVRDDGRWIGMHPRLVAVFSCALADRIAQANALTPVTHEPRVLALPRNWTVDELGGALLSGAGPSPPDRGPAATVYACAALRAVVPANLEDVPVARIVQARHRLADEFLAFRSHVDALGAEFAVLDEIEDPGILRSRLDAMVRRDVTGPVRDLERGLRSLGLEPARAVFGLRSLELPAVAALAAHALAVSLLGGAGFAFALQLYSAARSARRAAHERRDSAAGYLLGLRRELDPTDVLVRARRTLFGPR